LSVLEREAVCVVERGISEMWAPWRCEEVLSVGKVAGGERVEGSERL
jgi:hypothetical protein